MGTITDKPLLDPLERREEQENYGPVSRALHWLVFALVGAQFFLGWTMPHIRRTTPQEGLVDWHLSVGAVLMLVVAVRLIWRVRHPVPLTTTMAQWERWLAQVTHILFYVLLLIIPILGWAAAGYFGYTVRLFGLVPLPSIADRTMQWAHEAGDVHGALTWVLLALVGLHAAGGLWHYFIRRDRVLQRMLPVV